MLEAEFPNTIRDTFDEEIAYTRTWNHRAPAARVAWLEIRVVTTAMCRESVDGK